MQIFSYLLKITLPRILHICYLKFYIYDQTYEKKENSNDIGTHDFSFADIHQLRLTYLYWYKSLIYKFSNLVIPIRIQNLWPEWMIFHFPFLRYNKGILDHLRVRKGVSMIASTYLRSHTIKRSQFKITIFTVRSGNRIYHFFTCNSVSFYSNS